MNALLCLCILLNSLDKQTVMKVKPLSNFEAKNGTKNGIPDVLWLDVSSLPVHNKPSVMNKTLAYRYDILLVNILTITCLNKQ